MKKLCGLFLLSLMLLSAYANAAFVINNASIDGIRVTTTETSTFAFTGYNSYDRNFSANGFANTDASAGILANSTVMLSGSGAGFASTRSELSYEVNGRGDVNIDIDVSIFTNVIDPLGLEFVESSIYVSDASGHFDVFTRSVDSNLDFVDVTDATTLSFSFSVNGFESGLLLLETAVNAKIASTPVPAAVWLFLSGFVGLMQFMRRRS